MNISLPYLCRFLYLFQFVIRTFQLRLYVAPCRDVTILALTPLSPSYGCMMHLVVRFVPFQRQPVVAVHRYPLLVTLAKSGSSFWKVWSGSRLNRFFPRACLLAGTTNRCAGRCPDTCRFCPPRSVCQLSVAVSYGHCLRHAVFYPCFVRFIGLRILFRSLFSHAPVPFILIRR